MASTSFYADVVIVGGGSAGCVLANRLSADASCRVVLVEAGGEPRKAIHDIPVSTYRLLGSRHVDWCYQSTADPTAQNRRMQFNCGKVLGGSSAVNGNVYIRGARADFARWEELGATGWSFDDVLPYFRRAERFDDASSEQLGTSGPLSVSRPRAVHPLTRSFLDACGELGLARREDYSNGDISGAYLALGTTWEGRRCSASDAYVEPARRRPNLRVMTGRCAERILIEQGRAVGVRLDARGEPAEVRAKREVIVSCGTIGSPCLLMRSGIGPQEHLVEQGIALSSALPGVGSNLHDHAAINISKLVSQSTYNTRTGAIPLALAFFEYLVLRRGMLTSLVVQAMAGYRTDSALAGPDLLLNFLPLAMDFSGSKPTLHTQPGVTIGATLCQPRTRGRVTRQGAKASDAPRIDYQILADNHDVGLLVRACELSQQVFEQASLSEFVTADNLPTRRTNGEFDWQTHVLEHTHTAYHPVGTCRIGNDRMSVVDSRCRVHGVGALRVVDASIMPHITSANTNAPTVMIAEKASDLIRADMR